MMISFIKFNMFDNKYNGRVTVNVDEKILCCIRNVAQDGVVTFSHEMGNTPIMGQSVLTAQVLDGLTGNLKLAASYVVNKDGMESSDAKRLILQTITQGMTCDMTVEVVAANTSIEGSHDNLNYSLTNIKLAKDVVTLLAIRFVSETMPQMLVSEALFKATLKTMFGVTI